MSFNIGKETNATFAEILTGLTIDSGIYKLTISLSQEAGWRGY
jgi:hypothetical protein